MHARLAALAQQQQQRQQRLPLLLLVTGQRMAAQHLPPQQLRCRGGSQA
jgi:hypothetical protein